MAHIKRSEPAPHARRASIASTQEVFTADCMHNRNPFFCDALLVCQVLIPARSWVVVGRVFAVNKSI